MATNDGKTAMKKILESTDKKMVDLVRDSPKFGKANVEAKQAIRKIFEDAPTDPMENFIYYILVNYYSFKYLQNLIAQIEKNLAEKT